MPYQDPFEGLALPPIQQARGAVSRAGQQQPYGALRPRGMVRQGYGYTQPYGVPAAKQQPQRPEIYRYDPAYQRPVVDYFDPNRKP